MATVAMSSVYEMRKSHGSVKHATNKVKQDSRNLLLGGSGQSFSHSQMQRLHAGGASTLLQVHEALHGSVLQGAHGQPIRSHACHINCERDVLQGQDLISDTWVSGIGG